MKRERAIEGGIGFTCLALVLGASVTAFSQQPTPPPEGDKPQTWSVEGTLERLQKRLQAAEKEVNYLQRKYQQEKRQILSGTPPESVAKSLRELEEKLQALDAQKLSGDIEELSKRLDSVEGVLDQILGNQDKLAEQVKKDRLDWSGGFRVTFSDFHLLDRSIESVPDHLELVLDPFGQPIYDPATGSVRVTPVYREQRRDVDKWYGSNWVERLFLKLSFDITERLRFYGRLSVLKYMNELKPQSVTLDMHSTRYPRDPTLRIERAYIDWTITDWLVFSAGRIASAEGPPAELKEDTARSATWGVQMVEAEMETVMLTLHLDSFLQGLNNFSLRLFYMPFTTHTDFQLNDHLTLFEHESGFAEMHVLGGMFELEIPGLGNNLVQLGAAYIPAFPPRNVSLFIPSLNTSIAPVGSTSDTLGEYAMFTSLLEFTDIAGSGLDVFLAYHMTVLRPSDGRILYDVPVSLPIVHPTEGPTGMVFEGTSRLAIGLASYEEGAGHTNLGHLVYTGLRWTLPFWETYHTRLGAELNYGSKYHVAWSSPSDLLVNRLSTKGLAWEVYLIQELVPGNLFARLGFLEIRRDWEGLYLGPTTAVDQTIRNLYVLVDAHW